MNTVLKIAGRVAGIAAMSILIIGAIGVAVGFLHVGLKQPNEKTTQFTAVCTADDIKKYNDIIKLPFMNEAELTQKAERLQRYLDTIKTKAGFADDATCEYMAYTADVLNKNAADAQKHFNAVKRLADSGVSPSMQLVDLMGFESMQVRINALKTPEGSSTEEMGSG